MTHHPLPCQVMGKMLPRHMEIIEIINDGWTKWLSTRVKVGLT